MVLLAEMNKDTSGTSVETDLDLENYQLNGIHLHTQEINQSLGIFILL